MGEVLLTLDTATRAGSASLSRGETLLGEVFLNLAGRHSDRLLLNIRQLLEDTGTELGEVEAFGVVVGPGAFTGLRVGMATAKGLALATGKPVVGVSSLGCLALQAPAARYPVWALLDARKQEVYAGQYLWETGRPRLQGAETVVDPERLLAGIEGEALFVGEGARVYNTLIVRKLGRRAHFAPWLTHYPRASAAAVLALDALRRGEGVPPERLNPHYLRPSEAEIMWSRRSRDGAVEG